MLKPTWTKIDGWHSCEFGNIFAYEEVYETVDGIWHAQKAYQFHTSLRGDTSKTRAGTVLGCKRKANAFIRRVLQPFVEKATKEKGAE